MFLIWPAYYFTPRHHPSPWKQAVPVAPVPAEPTQSNSSCFLRGQASWLFLPSSRVEGFISHFLLVLQAGKSNSFLSPSVFIHLILRQDVDLGAMKWLRQSFGSQVPVFCSYTPCYLDPNHYASALVQALNCSQLISPPQGNLVSSSQHPLVTNDQNPNKKEA